MNTALRPSPEIAPTQLTTAELALFQERGYHIHGRVFTDSEVAEANAAADRVIQGLYDKGASPDEVGYNRADPLAVIKIDNTWKADTTLERLVFSPRIGHIAAQLIGAPSIRMWHDQLLDKPPFGGRVVTYHQDWAYWQMIAQCQTVTCWIALDDVVDKSGPMVFLEGTHKLGLWPVPDGITGDDEQRPQLPPGFKTREVPVVIPKGSVSFHHGLLLHGSGRNFSPFRRRAIVSHVMSGECTYRPGQYHMNEREMKKYSEYPAADEKFHGPQFPQIWPAAPDRI